MPLSRIYVFRVPPGWLETSDNVSCLLFPWEGHTPAEGGGEAGELPFPPRTSYFPRAQSVLGHLICEGPFSPTIPRFSGPAL